MKLLLYAAPKWSKSCSLTFPSVFENFSKFSPIPSNIVAPPSDIVEISAGGWKAHFSVKNSRNRIEIPLQTVTLYVVERPDLFPGHPT